MTVVGFWKIRVKYVNSHYKYENITADLNSITELLIGESQLVAFISLGGGVILALLAGRGFRTDASGRFVAFLQTGSFTLATVSTATTGGLALGIVVGSLPGFATGGLSLVTAVTEGRHTGESDPLDFGLGFIAYFTLIGIAGTICGLAVRWTLFQFC